MDTKSKIFLATIFALVIISIYLTFERAFFNQDFEIINSSEEEIS